jgi:hypothetical protein
MVGVAEPSLMRKSRTFVRFAISLFNSRKIFSTLIIPLQTPNDTTIKTSLDSFPTRNASGKEIENFWMLLHQATSFLHEHILSIPKDIADLASQIASTAQQEALSAIFEPQVIALHAEEREMAFMKGRAENREKVGADVERLEIMMREYLHGGV